MKDIYKKILISLSAFILVLSFSFTHLNTSKRFEVQASEYSITQQVATLIAVLLASVGIQLTEEPTLAQMQGLYDQLPVETQGILSSPTLGNNIVDGMIALPYAQAQTAIHSLVNTLNLDSFATAIDYYFDNNGNITTNLALAKTFVSSSGLYGYTQAYYSFDGLGTYALQEGTTSYDWVYIYGLGIVAQRACTFSTQFGIYKGSQFMWGSQIGYVPDSDYLGVKITSETNGDCNIWNGSFNPTGSIPTDGMILGPMLLGEQNSHRKVLASGLSLDYLLALGLVGSSLTLPAPSTGWDNSEPGDVDLDGWTKGLNIPDVGDVVVLGGLAAGTLAGLSPEAVLVPSDSQTPFDPSEDPDYGDEDPYNPPPAENASWFAAWSAAALGAGSALFGYDPVRDAFAAIQNAIQSIVQPLIDGMTSAFHAMLQTLMQPLVSAFSVMIQGLFALDIPSTQLKIEGIRSAIFARIPCVEETLNAWYQIMAVNGSNLISSFTFFGETFSISSGTLLQAFQGFGSIIKQAFRFVFWFIFLKGMRRRVTSFLGLVSAER